MGCGVSNVGKLARKKILKFGPMWQTKYALAVPKHLGLGFDFRPRSEAISSLGLHSPCFLSYVYGYNNRLRTPSEEIAFTARLKIKSQSQNFRYSQSIFCLPHRHKFSDFFFLNLHWVSVVRVLEDIANFISSPSARSNNEGRSSL